MSRLRLNDCTRENLALVAETSPLLASTPMCAFMQKYHWLAFFDERISGPRFCAPFFVDESAATQQRTTGLQKLRNGVEYSFRQLVALHLRTRIRETLSFSRIADGPSESTPRKARLCHDVVFLSRSK